LQLIEKLGRFARLVTSPVGAEMVRWKGCTVVQAPVTGVEGLPPLIVGNSARTCQLNCLVPVRWVSTAAVVSMPLALVHDISDGQFSCTSYDTAPSTGFHCQTGIMSPVVAFE